MSRFLVAILIAAALPLRADRVRVVVAVGSSDVRRASPLSVRAEVSRTLVSSSAVEAWGEHAFTAEIDREELERLARDPRVRAVSIDDGGEGALMESVPLVGANVVHAQGYDGRGVTVAVLDTGIDARSADFAGRIVAQQCFCDNLDGTGCCPNGDVEQSGDGAARDDHGHGTHVSGIVAGGGTIAPRGMAPAAKIVAVKVLDHTNTFRSFTQIYRALDWIARTRPDVKVVNMSLGSWSIFAPSACESSAIALGMRDVISVLRARGVLITASAGNQSAIDGTTIPACINDVLGIGATYDAEGEWSTCERDLKHRDDVACFSNSSSSIDLLAPGAIITATGRNGTFASMSGTSMAAPHVAGAIALMQQVSAGTISATLTETLLKSTGRPVLDPRNNLVLPRLDVAAAVAATPHVTPPPTPKRRGVRK